MATAESIRVNAEHEDENAGRDQWTLARAFTSMHSPIRSASPGRPGRSGARPGVWFPASGGKSALWSKHLSRGPRPLSRDGAPANPAQRRKVDPPQAVAGEAEGVGDGGGLWRRVDAALRVPWTGKVLVGISTRERRSTRKPRDIGAVALDDTDGPVKEGGRKRGACDREIGGSGGEVPVGLVKQGDLRRWVRDGRERGRAERGCRLAR